MAFLIRTKVCVGAVADKTGIRNAAALQQCEQERNKNMCIFQK